MEKRCNDSALGNTSIYGQEDEKKQSDRKKKQEESYLTKVKAQESFNRKKWSLSVKICREVG